MKEDRTQEPKECAGGGDYVTWEEELVLKRMRELKAEAGKTNALIKELAGEDGRAEELAAAEERLEELKLAFKELEATRDEARRHKMRALGHEE